MRTLTLDEARRLAHEIVDARPEYVYPNPHGDCTYAIHEEGAGMVPSCVVGHMLAAWDDEVFGAVVESSNDESVIGIFGGSIGLSVDGINQDAVYVYRTGLTGESEEVRVDGKTLAYLQSFQNFQDTDYSWGAALIRAERIVSGEPFYRITSEDRGGADYVPEEVRQIPEADYRAWMTEHGFEVAA